ncbi:bifunctional protein-serine/threonine kinase/phosphatase [Rhodobacterales bacterium]|nr:bifunctional protein-serine/threonine kinase/phosphatase [Rhodobacterales bacterium]
MQNPNKALRIEARQCSSAGLKPENQDFHGLVAPQGYALTHKGIAVALADGISSSPQGAMAAETAVKSFLEDYYCTSEAWSVRTSAEKVITAANSWLHGETRKTANRDHGCICTFSALILKGSRAHVFHVGDSRVWRLFGRSLEPLTRDHRVHVSASESHLGRALGLGYSVEIDYLAQDIKSDDVFVLSTDGLHEFVPPNRIAEEICRNDDLSAAAALLVDLALESGSTDNITIQIVRVTELGDASTPDFLSGQEMLPPAPLPKVPSQFEGFRILRNLHASSRSHIYLAEKEATGELAALKFPSIDMRTDEDYLRRFAMEEWIARRIASPHVLGAMPYPQDRRTLFIASDYIEGQTLRQWMLDNPRPDLETVRGILEQVARGLLAFHRKEMIHQDLRPENIMIDQDGTVKIIDFGSVRIAGVMEAAPALDKAEILGTHQYSAPELFLGYLGTARSDLFSLGVIAYEMLTGQLPYGAAVGRATSEKAQAALRYRSARAITDRVPDWVDAALCKAVSPVPGKRHDVLSEFLEDLRRPGPDYDPGQFVPLLQRDPVRFWQAVSAVLAVLCAALFSQLFGTH